jgi:hypothetical protein
MSSAYMTVASDRLLAEILGRHCGDSQTALDDYRRLTQAMGLPDFVHRLREQDFPRSGSFLGRPPQLWYWVPGSKFGSAPALTSPLDPSFTQMGMGPGLTHGEPVRLLHALRALINFVPPEEQDAVAEGLQNPASHLDAVEELLWLRFWKELKSAHRGFSSTPGGRSFDWVLQFRDGGLVYAEVKFLPSTWAHLSDGDSHQTMPGALTGKATRQLPDQSKLAELSVVLVTTYSKPTEAVQDAMAAELEAAPNVDALLSWTRLGPIFAMSRDRERALKLDRRIARPRHRDFDPVEGVIWGRSERKAREEERVATNHYVPFRATKTVTCSWIEATDQVHSELLVPPDQACAVKITHDASTGEPIFERIPKYL